METKRLNLGCGRDYKAGWRNWDISKEVKADEYFDFTAKKFPADNDTFDSILCSGVLEQISANKDLVHVMNECWRVLKPNGVMTVIVPSAKFSTAFKDPWDIRQFTEQTFQYFDKETPEYKLYGSVYGFKPWELGPMFTNEHGIMTVELQKPYET